MSSIRQYVRENVFGRCGQAVSLLAASELIPRPEMPTSEAEVHEWWLVSPGLAAKLRAARNPVLQFCELHIWGREAAGSRARGRRGAARRDRGAAGTARPAGQAQ